MLLPPGQLHQAHGGSGAPACAMFPLRQSLCVPVVVVIPGPKGVLWTKNNMMENSGPSVKSIDPVLELNGLVTVHGV